MKNKGIDKRLVIALAMACVASAGVADAATKDITLTEGWNLVNTPLEPSDPLLETIMADQFYVSAWVWDNSKMNWQVRLANEGGSEVGTYATSKGFATLNKLHAGQGVWLNMLSAGTLQITGTAPTTNTTINPVAKGWNLVGTRTDADKTVADVVTALGNGVKPLSLWKWKNNNWAVALPFNTDGTATADGGASYATSKGFDLLTTVGSTEGYWLNASAASGVVTPPDNGSGTTGISQSDESCMVCHTKGKVADIADSTKIPNGHAAATAVDQTVSNVVLTSVSGKPQVAFHVATAKGPVTGLTASNFRIYMADLVPAGTATSAGTFSTPYFEQWASEQSSTTGKTFTEVGNGDYTWAFSQPFGTITANSGLNNSDYSANHTQRLVMRVSGATGVTNNTVAVLDYTVTADGQTVTPLNYTARQFVTIDACKKCHGPQMAGAAHASSYLDIRVCDICHSPLYGSSTHPVGFMNDDNTILPVFIHQIHSSVYTKVPDLVGQPITFPQEINNCVLCHTNNGLALGDGDQIDNWMTHPTRQACGSCHTAVNFVTGAGHSIYNIIQTDDTECVQCHHATGDSGGVISVEKAHALTVDAKNVPEYDITLTLTPPANTAAEQAKSPAQLPYYAPGETFTVTATLKYHAAGTIGGVAHAAGDPVPASVYAQTTAGTKGLADGILNAASLYVYGPRSNATPLMKVYNSSGLLVQATNLLGHGDANGFHYDVTVPAAEDLSAGTYIVRTKFADFGYVSDSNYQIDSIAFTPIQVGANVAATNSVPAHAVVEKKVAGDGCINCHGTGTAPFHDARHSVHFDTDECLACHDQSGNYANVIANRVHSIHAASKTGDSKGIDWSDVTYPQNIKTCVTCHNSGSTLYQTVIQGVSCKGCHADDPATNAHMQQNGL